MNNDIPTQFRTALNHLLQQEGRGAQVRLARVENIDRGYLNAIIKGRKPGAEAIRSRIAAHFGMTYEEMLLLGRRLLAGGTDAGTELCEAVSRRTEREGKGTGEGRGRQEDAGVHLADSLRKALDILESKTKFSESLVEVITVYHEALTAGRDQDLDTRLRALEERVRQMAARLPDGRKGRKKS
jgi:citrate lyase gamma subunit